MKDLPRVVAQGLPLTLPISCCSAGSTSVYATEAAAVAAMHAILPTLDHRSRRGPRLRHVMQESLRQSASAALIAASAFIMNYAIAPPTRCEWFARTSDQVSTCCGSVAGFLLVVPHHDAAGAGFAVIWLHV